MKGKLLLFTTGWLACRLLSYNGYDSLVSIASAPLFIVFILAFCFSIDGWIEWIIAKVQAHNHRSAYDHVRTCDFCRDRVKAKP